MKHGNCLTLATVMLALVSSTAKAATQAVIEIEVTKGDGILDDK